MENPTNKRLKIRTCITVDDDVMIEFERVCAALGQKVSPTVQMLMEYLIEINKELDNGEA